MACVDLLLSVKEVVRQKEREGGRSQGIKGLECKIKNMGFIPIVIAIHWRVLLFFLSIVAAMWIISYR